MSFISSVLLHDWSILTVLALLINLLTQNIVIVILSFLLTFGLPSSNAAVKPTLSLAGDFIIRIWNRGMGLLIYSRSVSIHITIHFAIEKLGNTSCVMMIIVKTTLLHELIILTVQIWRGLICADCVELLFTKLFELLRRSIVIFVLSSSLLSFFPLIFLW